MTFTATVHRVMIASPGDVQPERDLVRDIIHEWNSLHGAREKTMLLPVGWETDVAPEMGDAPQSIINKRILNDADLLVGIFWTRIGTPTANYASGAVEEIEEHLAAGKPAMLYFSSAPAALDSVDPDQYRALKAFKDSCKSRGVFQVYAGVDDFRHQFSRQLQITMNTECGDAGAAPVAAPAPPQPVMGDLSAEAIRLLKAASASPSGAIYRMLYGGGAEIQANDEVFNPDMSPRTIALWEGAIDELEQRGYVRAAGTAREVFDVTNAGYKAADSLPA
jgi:hypothetical protein